MTRKDDFGSDEWAGMPSLRELFTVVFKRWKMIVIFAVVVFVGAIVFALTHPDTYVVKATLLVDRARADVALAPTDSSQVISQLNEQDLNSEVEALKNRELIEEVVKALGVGEQTQSAQNQHVQRGWIAGVRSWIRSALGSTPLPAADQMVLALSNQIGIDLIKKSNVIEVSYRSRDPEWATRVVRTFTERYIQHRAERGQARQAVSFFEGQMKAAEEKLTDSEAALEKYLEENQFTLTKGPVGSDPLAAQKSLVINRLALLRNEAGDAEANIQELSRRIDNLKSRLAQEPERLFSPDSTKRDPTVAMVKEHLTQLELKRDELLQDFKPDSRYVRDIEAQIELAEKRLAEASADVGAMDGTEVNPIHQSLKEELLSAEAELVGMRARYAALQQQVGSYQNQLDSLNEKAFELDALHRQAQTAQEEYLLYRKKHEEARISEAMDQQKLINVTIVQPAQRPLKPEALNLRLLVLFGLLGGILGGIGLAFTTEFYLDHSFTTGYEIERRLGISHIASIPEGAQ